MTPTPTPPTPPTPSTPPTPPTPSAPSAPSTQGARHHRSLAADRAEAPLAEPSGRQVILGAGPVGRAVAARLVDLGQRPEVVTRGGKELDGCAAIAADLTVPGAAAEVIAGAAVVFQCAQPAYHRWPEEFPALQERVLEAAAASDALLVAVENVYGYGLVDGPYREELPLAATTRKGRTRAAMWRTLEDAHRTGRCRTVAARASDFYGPGVTASSLGERFFDRLVRGRPAEVLGDPNRLHTYTYVPDLAAAMVRLSVEPSSWGRAWHVPNAPATSTIDVLELAAQFAGVEPRSRRMGAAGLRIGGLFIPAARETLEMLYEFTHDHVVDDAAILALLGSGPGASATPLGDGLRTTVEWYQRRLGMVGTLETRG